MYLLAIFKDYISEVLKICLRHIPFNYFQCEAPPNKFIRSACIDYILIGGEIPLIIWSVETEPTNSSTTKPSI